MAEYSAGNASLNIVPSMKDFTKKLHAELETIDAEFEVEVSPNLEAFSEKLRAKLESVDRELRISTQADTTDLTREVAVAREEAEKNHVHINVEADTEHAREQLHDVEKEDRTATINADADTGAARGKLAWAARTRFANIVVRTDAGSLAESARLINLALNQTAGAANTASTAMAAMNFIKFGGLITGINSIVVALGGVIGIAGGTAGSLMLLGSTGVVGARGVGAALMSMGQDAESAGESAAAAAKQQEQAQDSLSDAIERQEQAQKNVARSQRDLKQAQDDLNRSYRDAARDLRDMNDQLRDAELSQKGSKIALERAKQDRARVYGDSKSTNLDRAEADFRVEEAEQRHREAQARTHDARQDAAEANAKGVAGSDRVVAAREREAQAQEAVANSQKESARSTREVARAQEALADSFAAAGGGASEYQKALEKLSPNARDFVESLQALRPELSAFRMAVQDSIFVGLGAAVAAFVHESLPLLQDGMVRTGGLINQALLHNLSEFQDMLGDLSQNGVMDAVFSGMEDALAGVAPMLRDLTEAFFNLTANIGPSMGEFFKAFGESIQIMTPGLIDLGNATNNLFVDFLPILADLINMLGEMLVPLVPIIVDFFQTFANIISQNKSAFSEFATTMAEVFASALRAIAPYIPVILDLFIGLGRFFTEHAGAIVFFAGLAGASIGLSKGLLTIGRAMQELIGVTKIIFALLSANPLGLIITASGILIGVLVALYKHCTPFREVIDGIAHATVEFFKSLPERVKTAWAGVERIFRSVVNFFREKWGAFNQMNRDIRDNVLAVFDKIQNAAMNIGRIISDVFKRVVMAALRPVAHFIGHMLAHIPNIPGSIDDGARNWGNKLLALNSGGRVSGPGGPTDDKVPAMLSDGEFVVNARSAKQHRGLLEAINSGQVAHYAEGGPVSAEELDRFAQGVEGAEYQMGGVHYGDCSGWVGSLARFAVGLDPWQRMGSTFNEDQWLSSLGFKAGLGGSGALNVGWYNGPSGAWNDAHTAATLPNGVNTEMGGSRGNGQYGGGAVGATSPQFTHHMHLPASAFIVVAPETPAADTAPGDAVEDTDTDSLYAADDAATGADVPAGDYSTSSASSSGDLSAPDTISDAVGDVAKAGVSGYLSDALGVFGADHMPPALQGAIMAGKLGVQVHNREVGRLQAEQQAKANGEEVKHEGRRPLVSYLYDAAPAGLPMIPTNRAEAREQAKRYGQRIPRQKHFLGTLTAVGTGGAVLGGGAIGGAALLALLGGGKAIGSKVLDVGAKVAEEGIHRAAGATMDTGRHLANLVFGQAGSAVGDMVEASLGAPAAGLVAGPGGPLSDKVPASLSNGEFVMNAAATSKNLPFLQAMNAGATISSKSNNQSTNTAVRNSTFNINTSDIAEGLRMAKIEDFIDGAFAMTGGLRV